MTRLLCPSPALFSVEVQRQAAKHLDARFGAMNQARFDAVAPTYDAIMVRFSTRIDANVLGANSKIRAILSPTTGLDHIDLAAARRRGVRLFHLRDRKALLKTINPTAELAIALMLALLRHLPDALAAVKEGQWRASDFRGHEVAGKTIGIVGYGRLGRKVARTARALDMNVIAYDPHIATLPAFVARCRSLGDLMARADVVSVHVPLNDATKGLIGAREIARMKKDAVLVNTARGAIVDDKALLAALRGRRIAGAATDVLEGEWKIESAGHPMIAYARRHPNLLITPHIGGATYESVEKTDMDVLNRYLRWLERNRRR